MGGDLEVHYTVGIVMILMISKEVTLVILGGSQHLTTKLIYAWDLVYGQRHQRCMGLNLISGSLGALSVSLVSRLRILETN